MNTAQQVIAFIRHSGPASRAEVARRLGRSKPATSAAIGQLLRRGLLAELGPGRGSVGRPPTLLTFNTRSRLVAGAEVDVGQLRVGLGDVHGDLLELRGYAWESGTLGQTLLRALGELAGAQGNAPIHALALGLPGVVEEGAVRYAPNLPELERPGMLETLREELGLPTLLHNDVNLAAVGEARPGELLAFVSIGSGFGVGLTQGKRLLSGHRGRAGELGYLPAQGSQNLESVLSEAGLCRLLGLTPHQLTAALAGRDPAILRGEAAAPFLDALLQVLQTLTVTLDPARIVIGGRIGRKFFHALPALQGRLERTLPFTPGLSISPSPENAVVLGALQTASERACADLLHDLGQRPAQRVSA